jgi:hypothetical protein
MVRAFLAWLTGLARALPAPRRQEWAFVQPTLRPSWHVGTEEWRSRVWRVATRGPGVSFSPDAYTREPYNPRPCYDAAKFPDKPTS